MLRAGVQKTVMYPGIPSISPDFFLRKTQYFEGKQNLPSKSGEKYRGFSLANSSEGDQRGVLPYSHDGFSVGTRMSSAPLHTGPAPTMGPHPGLPLPACSGPAILSSATCNCISLSTSFFRTYPFFLDISDFFLALREKSCNQGNFGADHNLWNN